MTLHKGQKQTPFITELGEAESQPPAFVASEQAARNSLKAHESITERITRLEQQLRKVKQERAILKKPFRF